MKPKTGIILEVTWKVRGCPVKEKKNHIICFVLDFCPGPVLETDVWVVCTWG